MNFHFITGGAGVGKSHTLRQMIGLEQEKYIIVAPTGIAAINVGGATIHSAFKIDPSNGFVNPQIKYGPLRGLKKIYIDEISMVSNELMESLVFAAEMLGVTDIIGFGDLAQLKPVQGGWFFEFMEPTETTRLTVCHRQKDDLEFAEILNRIRKGEHNPNDISWVNSHKGTTGEGLTLAFANKTVEAINTQRMALIGGIEYTNVAQEFGSINERDVPGIKNLSFKVGCDVIMLVNDKEKRFQNGTRGRVLKVVEDNGTLSEIWIESADGAIIKVNEHTWKKQTPKKLTEERKEYWESVATADDPLIPEAEIALARHTLRNGYEMETIGTFTQFPFKLGYASTVHKSQGLTLDKVIIRPEGFDSMHGLGYVALSRLTSVSGLTTYRNLTRHDFLTNPKVKPFL